MSLMRRIPAKAWRLGTLDVGIQRPTSKRKQQWFSVGDQ